MLLLSPLLRLLTWDSLLGYNNNSRVVHSYATGNVVSIGSRSYAGALVGENIGSSIVNSYALGNLSSYSASTAYAGGLVASNVDGSPTTNSYRNMNATILYDTSNTFSQNTNGTELSEAQFKSISGDLSPNNLSSDSTITRDLCTAIGGTWMNSISSCPGYSNPWNLGTADEFPGLCIGDKIHRPIGSASSNFNVIVNSNCN